MRGNGGATNLGERLGKRDLVTLLDEMTDGKRVFSGISGRETLVGHVEEGEQGALLNPTTLFVRMYKIGRKFKVLTLTMSEISCHCSGVGSTPVGLCAQACKRTMLFSGAACPQDPG